MRLITSSRVFALYAAVLVCMSFTAGCLEETSTASTADLLLDKPDPALQERRDRPPSAKTLYALADILAKQGRDPECEQVLTRLIREYPQFVPAYNSLAELQMRQNRVRQAMDTLAKGLQIHAKDPVLLNNLGICWLVRKDYDRALEMFTKAAGVVPENARYRANMAVTLALMERYDESLSLFKQVLPKDQAKHNLEVLRRAADDTTTDS